MPTLHPVTLEGRFVRLEPLTYQHFAALRDVGADESLWELTVSAAFTDQSMRAYIDDALAQREAGKALPFVTIERSSNRVVGSTRFGNIDLAHRRAEIGWSWLGRPWQRTALNTEAKYLMLRHAFEELGWLRVEIKTDLLNERSRASILRLGAKEEGIFRKHQVTWTGRVRDTVWFSVIDDDWPGVKARLEAKLGPGN